jgi:hypothetical protein
MAKHHSRGISSVNEERMEEIGWTPKGSGKVQYFFIFIFRTLFLSHFVFVIFISFHFILFCF